MHFREATQYQPGLLRLFESEKIRIQALLPKCRIEHIGASAIEGAISKGDLDLFVGIESNQFQLAIGLLGTIGYLEYDGTPRTKSHCMLKKIESEEDVAIQLVETGSEFEFFIHFRDQMRADPQLVEEYNELKRKCTGMEPDDYRAIKSAFVERVLRSCTKIF
jgi:GrpB-like predicted nucleotidyltransferase (UPF0157 family)